MRKTIGELLRALQGHLPEPIADFGTRQPAWQAGRPSVTDLLQQAVIRCDIQAGPDVDRIEDLHHLTFPDNTLGTALLLDVVEHVARPWEALAEIKRVLRPGGVLLMTSHFYFPLHAHPDDFWRFTTSGFTVLLNGFTILTLRHVGVPDLPHTVAALAYKDGEVTDLTEQTLIVQRWVRDGASGWPERVLSCLPPLLVGPLYRLWIGWQTRRALRHDRRSGTLS